MFTRREFGRSLIAVPLALRAESHGLAQTSSPPLFDLNGVRIGLETFSFHDLPPAGDPALLPTLIGNMREVGIGECEIMSGHVEPFASVSTGWWVQSRRAPGYREMRDAARQWRLTTPPEYYTRVREQFAAAGLRMHLYNVNFNETFTDAERDRTFEAAKALGVAGFSSSTVISEARRLVPFVERHQMFVAMHNHNNLVDPDQFATPQSFETALAMSPWFKVTLDIGHFTAGNNDPVSFIAKWHERIVNIHVRDRKRNNGPNRPFGKGDTPIAEVLRLIKANAYSIRCYLEYEYGSFRRPVEELKACLDYCRSVLS